MIPPKNYPVEVRRVYLANDAGYCEFNDKKQQFDIRINNKLCSDAAILILLHEWAHALTWEHAEHPEVDEEGHGSLFGHYYAIVWRHWCGELDKLPPKKQKFES